MKNLAYGVAPNPNVQELRKQLINTKEHLINTFTCTMVESELKKKMFVCPRNRNKGDKDNCI